MYNYINPFRAIIASFAGSENISFLMILPGEKQWPETV